MASAALAVPPIFSTCSRPPRPSDRKGAPVVVIVGAGLAGLTAAYQLRQRGIPSTVYEAASRIGGRVYSVADRVAPGSITEFGGEYIDSVHGDMLALAHTFGLELVDLEDPTFATLDDTLWFDGKRWTDADLVAAIRPYVERIAADAASIPDSPEQLRFMPESKAVRLDSMSLASYLASLGMTGWIRSFIETAFVTENGLELDSQSTLAFLRMVSTDVSSDRFDQFGDSDERFKVRGGNARIVSALAQPLQSSIETGYVLERIAAVGERYQLTFRKSLRAVEVLADVIICAIPFSVLREVDLRLPLSEAKRDVIQNLRYGANSKTMFSFAEAFWRRNGDNGFIYTDLGPQLVWDNTALQGLSSGGLTCFNGGALCREISALSTPAVTERLMRDIIAVWPDAQNHTPLRTDRMNWPSYAWSKGSYSSYGPRETTRWAGIEGMPEGRLFFAGEHCSVQHKGYMNGAVETGRMAAQAVATLIGKERG